MSRNDDWRDDDASKYMRFTPEEEALSDEELDAEIAYLKKSLYDWHFRVFLSPEEYANVNWDDEVTNAQLYATCLAREAERERERKGLLPASSPETKPAQATAMPLSPGENEVPTPPVASPSSSAAVSGRDVPEPLRAARRCEYIKANNQQCGSPARSRGRFCYFHEESRQGRKNKKRMQMPVLEDQRALQMAVTKICQGIIDESIEPKRASTLLYGLQVASTAVSKPAPAKNKR